MEFKEKYRKIFAIEEIESSRTLQMVFFFLFIGFYYGIHDLFFRDLGIRIPPGSFPTQACPEYFQGCHRLYFLPPKYESWAYSVFFTGVFTLLAGSLILGVRKMWTEAHMLLVIPFFVKMFFNLFLSANVSIPFEIDHLFPCFIFLFSHKKKINLQFLFVILYFLSGIVKLHQSWIAGTYFSSLAMGLPLFPDAMIPVVTNIVVLMEIVGVWLLFSQKKFIRKSIFVLLIIFHVYSCLFVGFRYPMQFLPFILILFSDDEIPLPRPSKLAWLAVTILFLMNLFPFLIGPDHKRTFEGRALALNMFDSNRQSKTTEIINYRDGKTETKITGTSSSVERLTPYTVWFRIQQLCKRPEVEKVSWNMLSSMNGGPFTTLVDEDNACLLSYHFWKKNEWIRYDSDIKGYPGKNHYYGPQGLGAVPVIHERPVFEHDDMTKFLIENTQLIGGLYLFLAFLVIVGIRKKRI